MKAITRQMVVEQIQASFPDLPWAYLEWTERRWGDKDGRHYSACRFSVRAPVPMNVFVPWQALDWFCVELDLDGALIGAFQATDEKAAHAWAAQ